MKIKLLTLSIFVFLTFLSCSSSDNDKKTEPDSNPQTSTPTIISTKTPEKTLVFSQVIVGGNITIGTDEFAIFERGVSWAETTKPTIANNKSIASISTNDFSITVNDLTGGTTYYFRAYASNEEGETIYGDEKQVITDAEPITVSNPNHFLPSAGTGKSWILQPKFSNEFDYSQGKTSDEFNNNWQDKFFNDWTGPKKSGTATTSTIYTSENSSIKDGELVYKATINGNNVHTGCISSKKSIGYPLYMEARVKISESSLATAVWLLSEDSTQEIDNLEAYGNKSNNYFSKRLHLSHHTFIRQPFQDYQPNGPETWYADEKGTLWADDYHRYGVLWLDPWTLKYYVDGGLVRETPTDEIDPLNYTSGTGLNKDMYLIISAAAQPWRETAGQVENFVTDPSVTDPKRSEARIDYIRTYKPE